VLRIDMDGAALANTRFAISPLNTTVGALWLLREDAWPSGGGWRALVQEAVRDRKLIVLGSLFGGSWDYVPDLITPQPDAPEGAFQEELHLVATADCERLRWEFEVMIHGSTEDHLVGRPASTIVRDVLERGERELAERLAAELDQVWHSAIAPHWVTLRARMEADIARRAQTIAQYGLSAMLTGLHPRVVWNSDHLRLMTRFKGWVCGSTSLVLTPSVFATDLHMVVDSLSAPVQRQPMFAYPALRGPDTAPAPTPTAHALLGVTRARLLSDLESARTTAELGERHFLAASTVSYHLGILHRSGLVTRTRTGHRVLYERTPRAASLLIGLSQTG
jgi:hypothetical protein